MLKLHLTTGMVVVLCFTIINGCAVTKRENRLTLNYLDSTVQKSVVTRNTVNKIVAAPIAFTTGVVACTIDGAIITPARAAVSAAKDTNIYLWKNPQGSEFRQMMLLLPKVIATPVVFATDWTFRTAFTTSF